MRFAQLSTRFLLSAAAVLAALAAMACAVTAATASPAAAAVLPTNAADNLRTGWYPDQPGLAPATVGGSQFGRLFKAPVTGQVYAQPLVFADTLLVVTEGNWVYGLDPATGAQRWPAFNVGTPFDPDDVGCGDLTPEVGITGTPTVDPDTGLAYFAAKTYGPGGRPRYDLHAISVATGAEAPGFPVALTGRADDNANVTFDARYHLQRPGLLLLDGVVYVAFGGHCDRSPWQGWVFGVDADSGATTARWVANSSGHDGAGIWQSGGGLVSDGPGRILLTTGNGDAPSAPTPGRAPPTGLGEALVRLDVQGDGRLRAVDFFAPYDATDLDSWDADFGSTAPTVLPRPWFGDRPLAVAGGKAGFFYLYDANDLGGIKQSPTGGDRVLQQLGPLGGTWSRFGVWPGDGGWVYYPTAAAAGAQDPDGRGGRLLALSFGADALGQPRFSLAGQSSETYGFGSGAPVVTSVGDTSGSALVWLVYAPNGDGYGAELRAYDPVPVGGVMQLRRSFPIGRSTKFTPPGIAGGRVYVGTRDGFVHGFGVPANAPLEGNGASFPETVVGQASAPVTVTLRATTALDVTAVTVSGPFTVTQPSLPRALASGQQISIPVRFAPTTWGLAGGTLALETSAGPVDVGLSGYAVAAQGLLVASNPVVRFGGVVPGRTASDAVSLSNVGATPVTLTAERLPAAPFALDGPLPVSLAPGQKVTLTVTFAPQRIGAYESELVVGQSGGAPVTVGLTGASVEPAKLTVDPPALDFGARPLGTAEVRSFTLTNSGGAPLTLTKSKPPTLGAFSPASADFGDGNPIPEGTVLAGGESVEVPVRFQPFVLGDAADSWILNATDDGGGVREVPLRGSGALQGDPGPPDDDGDGDRPPGGASRSGTPAFVAPRFSTRRVRVRASRGARSAAVRVACPRAAQRACRGTLVLRGRAGRRGRLATLGRRAFAVRPGRSAPVTVPLARAARRPLLARRALTGAVELRARDGAGKLHVGSAALTVLPPKR